MISIDDISSAATRLRGVAVETPLIRCAELDQVAGGRIYVKPECLQVTGSFKIRGAYNLLSQLGEMQAKNGVVAWSSGNHAQGVAAAGGMLGISTAIVMPEDAPKSKIENTQRLGGEIILYNRYEGDREKIAKRIAAERGASIVPSYDHPHIIAGQGTVGLEMMLQAQAQDTEVDQALVCCGGGGLIAGSAIAMKSLNSDVKIYPVEPICFDDTARSLCSGQREKNHQNARSICDALQTESPGEITFPINKKLLEPGLTVSDDDVRSAMRFAFRNLKLVVEPGGAVALAAILAGKVETARKTTLVVLSGGNVDYKLFSEIMADGD